MTQETETETQKYKSEEWVLVGTNEPQNFYVGKVETTSPDMKGDLLRTFIDLTLMNGRPLRLVDARLLLTMVQFNPTGGIGLMTQVLPISACTRPARMHLKPTVVMFASDIEGMPERIDEMMRNLDQQELRNRAKAVGIVTGDEPNLPNLRDLRKI